jgi:metallo-beta-lactamase class B
VTVHLEKARKIAGNLYLPVQQHLCYIHSPEDEARLAARSARAQLRATRVFDDFYYVGAEEVAAWALTTSEGIILFDSLDNPEEAKTDIVQGLRELGLNPAQIKYVVITHGHGDHFGGAQYLQDTFGARLLASAADWEVIDRVRAGQGPPQWPPQWGRIAPKRDLVASDGQVLTLGDTHVTFHITPGHSPGTISSIFQVKDQGRVHTVAFWGGVGLPTRIESLRQYIRSGETFRRIARDAGADVAITNHPHADMTLEGVARIHDAKPGDPNPLVVGRQGVERWFGVIGACAEAQQARLDLGLAPMGRASDVAGR